MAARRNEKSDQFLFLYHLLLELQLLLPGILYPVGGLPESDEDVGVEDEHHDLGIDWVETSH